MGEEDELNLNNSIANEENKHNHFGPDQYEDQQNYFGANQDDNQDDLNVDNVDKNSVDDDVQRDQVVQDNSHIIPKDNSSSDSSLDCQDINGSDLEDESDDYLDESP